MTKNGNGQHWQNRIVGSGEERPDQLLANPYNFRIHPQHQQEALAGVLNEVGWVQQVIVNKRTGNLMDGHLRVSLALRNHEPTIPVLYVDVSEEEEKLILATLDPISALAGTDAAKLDELLRDVQSGEAAVQAMLAELAAGAGLYQTPAPGNGGDDFDTTPDEGPTRTQSGDLWRMGEHRLVVGDSTDPATVARLMGGERAGLIVTDPPYAVAYVDKARDMNRRGYGHSRATLSLAIEGDEIDDEQATQIWEGAFSTAAQVALLPHAAWYVWHAPGRATRTMLNVLDGLGLLHHQTIIWKKNNFVIGRCDYQWIHEPCFYGWMQGNRPPFLGAKNQTTVWDIGRDATSPIHPTQKPVAIFLIPIENHLQPREIAFDPFGGSGTTLIACERTGRKCRMVEIEPRYADVILRRYEAETGHEAELVERLPSSSAAMQEATVATL